MGTKYSTTAVSGYNATPPADDGSVAASNKVTWASIKTKLPDPLKTAIEAIDTKLVTAADLGPVSKTTTYTTVAGDHQKTLECSGTFTVSLLTAASALAGYTVEVNNQGTGTITVSRATGTDTINGTAGDVTIAAKNSQTFRCNASNNGYDIIACALNTGTSGHTLPLLDGTNTWSAPQTFAAITAGTSAGALFFFGAGLATGNATGGDKGAGTINAAAVYDDNVLLTDYVFDAEQDGAINLAAYDGKVADRKIKDKDGKVTTEVRTHVPARAFDMTELDPVAYAAKCSATRRLPAMHRLHQRVGEGEKTGLGETLQALIETCEVQAVHIAKLEARLAALGG